LAAVDERGLALWDLATGTTGRFEEERFFGSYEMAFSPDGNTLAVTGTDSRPHPGGSRTLLTPLVLLLDVRTGKVRLRLKGPEHHGDGPLAFSPDGRLLATANRADQVPDPPSMLRLWDATTGELLCKLNWSSLGVRGLAFAPDGKTLAVNDNDHTVLMWDLPALPELKQWYRKKMAPRTPPGGKTSAPPRQEGDLKEGEAERLWADLAADDAAKAYRAMWRLALHPKQSLPVFKARLQPVTAPKPQHTAGLIAALGARSFKTRERAHAELGRLVFAVAPELRHALKVPTSKEAERHLRELVQQLELPVTAGARLRGVRAIEALEHIASPEAVTILKAVAAGAPGALETIDAKLALERLARRRLARP
jgi:hypothetical protein